MAFWARQNWLEAGWAKRGIVRPWNEDRIEEAGYRLSVGKEIYINSSDKETIKELKRQESFVVGPGQFVYILTDEYIEIPRTQIGFISIRASVKFKGLLNVSGFQVNPGFEGHLIFAVFNAGPMIIHLTQGDEIFCLWMADLATSVDPKFKSNDKIPFKLRHIPTDIANNLNGQVLTAYHLKDRLDALEKTTSTIRNYLWVASIIAGFLVTVYGPKISELKTLFSEITEQTCVTNDQRTCAIPTK